VSSNFLRLASKEALPLLACLPASSSPVTQSEQRAAFAKRSPPSPLSSPTPTNEKENACLLACIELIVDAARARTVDK